MLTKTVLICLLIGSSFAREDASDEKDLIDSEESVSNSKREATISTSYGPPSSGDKEPAPVYGPPSGSLSSSPSYSKSIPAAAIRNVETVAVTKTITPVVTKTTTYNTHSEPALSIGHVQGYSHSAQGQPKIAPVQFQTQYTSYHNPTVGVNGPVTYTGPAVVVGGGYAIPLTGLSSYATAAGGQTGFTLSSISAGSPSPSGRDTSSPVYGPPSESPSSEGPPASTYGPPSHTAGRPLGSYSMNLPQYVSLRPSVSAASSHQHALSLHNIQQLQKLRAPAPYSQQGAAASAISPVAIARPQASSPYAFYQQPIRQPQPSIVNPALISAFQQASPSNSIAAALRYHPQQVAALHQLQQQQSHSIYHQQPRLQQRQHHPHQPISQPTVQYIQTYAMPSISFTRLQPVSGINKNSLSPSEQAQILRAIRQ